MYPSAVVYRIFLPTGPKPSGKLSSPKRSIRTLRNGSALSLQAVVSLPRVTVAWRFYVLKPVCLSRRNVPLLLPSLR